MRRRTLLALAGTSLSLPLSGCLGGGDDESGDGPGSESDDAEAGGADEQDDSEDTDGQEDSEPDPDEGQDREGELAPSWPSGPYEEYETTVIEVESEGGELLGRVKAAIAHPGSEWTLGLSDAESMPEDAAMLFVSDSPNDETFWMRDMDFGLDIVYVGADRRITSIHHAPEPEPGDDGTEQKYQFSGTGQYVLEVNNGWTTERGVSAGDILMFER